MSPLSPGQLPSWDADLPRIIRTLYNHQNSNSSSNSVTFLQTQQQCRGTDTKVPRCPSLPQRSREPPGIQWGLPCPVFPSPELAGASPARCTGRRVITEGRGRSNRQGQKKKKKILLFQAKALQGVEELPLGIVSFLQPRLESHF